MGRFSSWKPKGKPLKDLLGVLPRALPLAMGIPQRVPLWYPRRGPQGFLWYSPVVPQETPHGTLSPD